MGAIMILLIFVRLSLVKRKVEKLITKLLINKINVSFISGSS
jgi:hypothetical protein